MLTLDNLPFWSMENQLQHTLVLKLHGSTPGTTVELSFPARKTAFVFTGQATAEVIISPEHAHVNVDGVGTLR